jgi:hypothetical protein
MSVKGSINNTIKYGKREVDKERFQKESASDSKEQLLCTSIAKNYEMTQGADIANGFILLMGLV